MDNNIEKRYQSSLKVLHHLWKIMALGFEQFEARPERFHVALIFNGHEFFYEVYVLLSKPMNLTRWNNLQTRCSNYFPYRYTWGVTADKVYYERMYQISCRAY